MRVSDAEVRNHYELHRADFRSGEEVRVRQILVHDEALANSIVAQLRKNSAAFEELSRQHSRAPNAGKGGEKPPERDLRLATPPARAGNT